MHHCHQISKQAEYMTSDIYLGPDHVQVFWKHMSIENISQLETRPMIVWPSESTNQRPGFQLTYASKTLAHDPALSLLNMSNFG